MNVFNIRIKTPRYKILVDTKECYGVWKEKSHEDGKIFIFNSNREVAFYDEDMPIEVKSKLEEMNFNFNYKEYAC